ncbi:MAG: phosphatidate cytidylyltransferase [Myxococcota bacterium]
MITRVLAAVVGLAVLLPTVIWGGIIAVDVWVAVGLLLCLDEYARMAFPGDSRVAFAWLVAGTGGGVGALLMAGADAAVGVWCVALPATMAFVTLRPGPTLRAGADALGRYALGMSWIGMLGTLAMLRRLEDGLGWVFLVLAISWCGDTGGYFAGRFLGRNKLYPRVSPKKTWEGVAGGVGLAVAGAFAIRAVILPVLTPLDCVVLGVGLSLAAVLGDLSESLLKRAYEVKDSGWILPGHGGLLDRIDSVLFVAPLLYGYAVFVKG